MTSTNLEEAAYIASEFISSLDNLPSEVQHLLQEMRHKESKAQELQQEIAKESAKYIRHALRHSPASSVPSTPITSSAPSPSPSTPNMNGANAKAHLVPKISASYAEIDRLSVEKVALAQRIVALIARTRARLEVDLQKVGVLQGDIVDYNSSLFGGSVLGREGSLSFMGRDSPMGMGAGFNGVGGGYGTRGNNNPASQISQSLRNALGTPGDQDMPGPSAQKKRRLVTNSSLKLQSSHASSPVPASIPPAAGVGTPGPSTNYARSRGHQIHRSSRRQAVVVQDDEDMDAEGEDDDEGDAEEGEDKGIYCFCQQMSHGEMIACDNDECPYQWFHLSCVNMKPPLPETFYCSRCREEGFGQSGGSGSVVGGGSRKGRRR